MSIYTRTGDDGSTSLSQGKRVRKDNPIIELNGRIDELNSILGLCVSFCSDISTKEFIRIIQGDLMEISSLVSGTQSEKQSFKKRIKEFEERIDHIDEHLPELQTFILPGGSQLASMMHVARSICRSVERQAVRAHANDSISYFNRLSDYLFTLARFINNNEGEKDILWKGSLLQKRKT